MLRLMHHRTAHGATPIGWRFRTHGHTAIDHLVFVTRRKGARGVEVAGTHIPRHTRHRIVQKARKQQSHAPITVHRPIHGQRIADVLAQQRVLHAVKLLADGAIVRIHGSGLWRRHILQHHGGCPRVHHASRDLRTRGAAVEGRGHRHHVSSLQRRRRCHHSRCFHGAMRGPRSAGRSPPPSGRTGARDHVPLGIKPRVVTGLGRHRQAQHRRHLRCRAPNGPVAVHRRQRTSDGAKAGPTQFKGVTARLRLAGVHHRHHVPGTLSGWDR